MWDCFWAIYSVLLIYASIFYDKSIAFNYYRFSMYLMSDNLMPLTLFLLPKVAMANQRLSAI